MTIIQSLKNSNLFYVTTPIFYVNAAPHIGHLYSAVIADCIFRYEKLRNRSSSYLMSTGTDEHGTKIQQAASLHDQNPAQYCNYISEQYKTLFGQANIQYTHFNRTTDRENHFPAVKHFWNTLSRKDCIYKTNYAGWYSVSDETFVPESQLKENDKKEKISVESGHPVKWVEETNYMFKLSKFHDDIEYWIKQRQPIRPKKFEKILLEYLKEPLKDISVSRPAARVSWAIPVPNDDTQTVYVWLDALINYLTSAGYPNASFTSNWPPQLHIIGKDILKFHGIYWPAFLIAAGLEPPSRLLVHSHWTVNGEKMSKSKKNVIDPNDIAKKYTYEGLRYFLLREGVPHSDGNYSDTKAMRIINAELVNTLGNLMSRICAKAINHRQVVPTLTEIGLKDLMKCELSGKLMQQLTQLPDKCATHFDSYNIYMAVDEVIATLHMTNCVVQEFKPWLIVKNHEKTDELNAVLRLVFEVLRITGIILQPIVPDISTRVLNKINVNTNHRLWNDANLQFVVGDTEKCLGEGNSILMERIS